MGGDWGAACASPSCKKEKPSEMIDAVKADRPSVGIFWVVEAKRGEPRLLAIGCTLEDAEPFGDFLTFGPGHYEIWKRWRASPDTDAALRIVVRTYEYEDWPRGRIVYDTSRERFTLYADRKLMTPKTITHIRSYFSLPPDRTVVESDFHYQSKETPNMLT